MDVRDISAAAVKAFAATGPDFLVISPPKTGSHWLAANLRAHPDVFVPARKEIKYFSSFYRWFDLDWYLDQFRAGGGGVKGEASPSYAILPTERIKFLHGLMPDLKLIYLMRDPIARAWSHAKHNLRFREANFATCTATLDQVSAVEWRANFVHDWPRASGDYLGHLRRWCSVFPPRQIFVGFYESIITEPEILLRGLFSFLGVNSTCDLSKFPVAEKIFAGMEGVPAPEVRDWMHRLFHARTAELGRFLREHFGLTPPGSWQTLVPPDAGVEAPVMPPELEDTHLSNLLEQEAAFPSPPLMIRAGYRGYNIHFYRGRLHAIKQSLGIRANELDEPPASHDASARFTASSMSEMTKRIDDATRERNRIKRLFAKVKSWATRC